MYYCSNIQTTSGGFSTSRITVKHLMASLPEERFKGLKTWDTASYVCDTPSLGDWQIFFSCFPSVLVIDSSVSVAAAPDVTRLHY